VGAAPLLTDDAPTASPELALVDPELAERLRSALAGPQRWHAPRRSSDAAPGEAATAIESEERSPIETAPGLDGATVDTTEIVSSDEAQPFAAPSTLPIPAEPAGHETDAFLLSIEAGAELAERHQSDVAEAAGLNDYPTLPASGDLDEAVEETDAALRRMREHLTSDEPLRRPRRVGRSVTVAAGICAVGAVAVLAADAQLGLATLAGRVLF
jgi:hypothetical protein